MTDRSDNKTKSNWRAQMGQFITKTADQIDDFVDIRWRSFRKRMGWEGVPKIQAYTGYANDQFIRFQGRILTNPPLNPPSEDDNWWDNILANYRRFASDEVPGVQVQIQYADQSFETVSDKEGYFKLETKNVKCTTASGPWEPVHVKVINSELVDSKESQVTGHVLNPPTSATFGVISDIDDTILHTGITGLLSAAKSTFLKNARSRKPLAGVAALYEALQHGPDSVPQNNPIFYVSSSPWNLYDLLEDFMELNRIPAGPILLRDLGFDEDKFLKEGHDHKLKKALSIIDAYPALPFLLFGDSGQEDAPLYAEAAKLRPGRILATFIRDVDPGKATHRDQSVQQSITKSAQHGVPMQLIETSNDAIRALQAMELIARESKNEIQVDVARDEAAPE